MKSRILLYIALAAIPLAGMETAAAQSSWPPDSDPVPQVNPLPNYGQAQYGQQPPQYSQQPYGQQPYSSPSYPQQNQPYPQQSIDQPQEYGGQPVYPQAQPEGAEQLEQLVAPIALYPDALVAQILTAATYPAQVSAAAQWIQSMQGAGADQIAAAVSAQTQWDPSIKALTAFPQVLEWLAGDLQWATALGNAYYNQPQDVLDTIQVMRQRAEQAGNLQSTPQEQVTDYQGDIAIAPVSPAAVYVPEYDPWTAYGAPVPSYPGFNFLDTVGSLLGNGLQYGLSFGMGAFSHTPFGLLAWGLDWLTHSVLFDHNSYWTHSYQVRDWGLPHGGPRWGGRDWAGYGGRGGYGQSIAENYRHEPLAVHGGEYGRSGYSGYGNGFAGRGEYGSRGAYSGDAFAGRGQEYARGGMAYGRTPSMGRLETYSGRPEYRGWDGSARQLAQNGGGERGFSGGERGFSSPVRPAPGFGFTGRAGGGYGSPQAFRGEESYGGRQFGEESRGSERAYAGGYGGGFAREPKSGGFHLFGGGHKSSGFDEHSSHEFKSSRSYGGGRSSHSFGGGRHSSGGGHWGGGHGGGHSSSHGGGHRR